MVSVLKGTAERHGPKNVLKLGNNLNHSSTSKETDFVVCEVDVIDKYSLQTSA
jgi:hypothetical protein